MKKKYAKNRSDDQFFMVNFFFNLKIKNQPRKFCADGRGASNDASFLKIGA